MKKALVHHCLNGYTIGDRNRAASVAASFSILMTEHIMPFFNKKKPSPSSHPTETREEIMQRRAREYIKTLQKHAPRAFEELLSDVEQGNDAHARLTLRGLASIIDEGYIDPILQEFQTFKSTY